MPRLNKADDKAYNKVYKEKNRDLIRAKDRARYALNIEKERLRCRIKAKKSSIKLKLYRKQYKIINKEKIAEQNKIYRKNNLDKHAAKEAKMRAIKLNATPDWLTKEQFTQIEEFYTLSKELQWLSLDTLEVDHIVPLQGKLVSGLHVPWNLQILPKSDNCRKGNRL